MSLLLVIILPSLVAIGPDAPFRWLGGGHNSEILAVDWSPDGRTIATGGGFIDGTVKLWDADSGRLLRTLKATTRASAHLPVYFSPDGRLVAGAPEFGEVDVWRVQDGVQVQTLPPLRWFAFSPDSRSIVLSRGDGTIEVYRISDGARTLVMTGHSGPAIGVAFAPDGSKIASAGEDGLVKLWSAQNGSLIASWSAHPAAAFQARVRFSPDGSLLASSGDANLVKIWRVSDHMLVRTLVGFGTIMELDFTADGSRLTAAGIAGQVVIWRVSDGAELATISTSQAFSAAFSPNGLRIAVAGGEQAQLFDAATGTQQQVIGHHRSYVSGMALSADASVLASAGYDGRIQLWNVSDGSRLQVLSNDATVFALARSSSDLLASGGPDDQIRLWRMSDGQFIRTIAAQSMGVLGLAFSPDDTLLVSAGRDATPVRIWRVVDGALLDSLAAHAGGAAAVAFTPDGSMFITGGVDDAVRIWRTSDRALLHTLVGHGDDVISLAVSWNGTYLASGDVDGVIKLWSMPSGALLRTLAGHGREAKALVFSRDNTLLISGGVDQTARFWRVSDGQLVYTLDRETGGSLNTDGGVWSLSLSPDGRLLAYGRDDATVVMADLCAIAGVAPDTCETAATVPAASAWGLMCMAIAVAAGGAVVLRRRGGIISFSEVRPSARPKRER